MGHAARFGVLAVSLTSFVAFAEPTPSLTRDGTSLSTSFKAPAGGGAWELSDMDGNTCARGEATAGPVDVRVKKLSPSTSVRFVVRGKDGTVITSSNSRGVRHLSPLPKLSGAVTLYQVPIRTYFARGLGAQNTGKLADFTPTVLKELKALGADYLWVTGVLEASSPDNTDADVVKGDAGSYYAIVDPWDVNPQIGSLDDFAAFLTRAHDVGLRVLIDYVVNHTARTPKTDVACKLPLNFGTNDDVSQFFSSENNFLYIQGSTFKPPQRASFEKVDGVYDTDIFTDGIQLESPARVTGNNVASAEPRTYDWFETAKLNYGYDFTTNSVQYSPIPRTWYQMLDVAKYWLEQGVDGFRIDVAHAVPIEFWRFLVPELKKVQPHVFLLAEAYESDAALRVPGFSYDAMLATGIDSIFNSELYGRLRDQGKAPGHMYATRLSDSPALRPSLLKDGAIFTNYLENHDEIRMASRHFAPSVGTRESRANLGLALSAFSGLLPGHFLIQGGQEMGEDASVMGGFSGDNGRTSIFDFVYQPETLKWLSGDKTKASEAFHGAYQALLNLRHRSPFNLPHTAARSTYLDLHEANWTSEQSYWVAAYLRYDGEHAYLVVTNSDPYDAHEATIHFTYNGNDDSLGVLKAAHIQRSADIRYRFTDVFLHPGWQPQDPNIKGEGVPGSVLYQSGGVPSGLYLGNIPASTTYVLKIEPVGLK